MFEKLIEYGQDLKYKIDISAKKKGIPAMSVIRLVLEDGFNLKKWRVLWEKKDD